MHLIACTDNRMGMMFNHRRVSRDYETALKIIEMVNGSPLYMSPYSLSFFQGVQTDVRFVTSLTFLSEAGPTDFCFLEDADIYPYEDSIRSITLLRWNRLYPSDRKLQINWRRWELVSTEEFPGRSHEKITKEVYRYVQP